jgi:hypothetical protein
VLQADEIAVIGGARQWLLLNAADGGLVVG